MPVQSKKKKQLERLKEDEKYDDKESHQEEEKIQELNALPRLSNKASARMSLGPTKAKIHLEPHLMNLERRKSQSKMTASLDVLFNRV